MTEYSMAVLIYVHAALEVEKLDELCKHPEASYRELHHLAKAQLKAHYAAAMIVRFSVESLSE